MDDLVKMVRGDDGADVAIVRPEWVEEWRGYGYVVEGEDDGDGSADKPISRRQAVKALKDAGVDHDPNGDLETLRAAVKALS